MVLVIQLLILCWSQPMWSTLVFVHEHSMSVKEILDMLLLVISAALQCLKNSGNIVAFMDKYHPSYGGTHFPFCCVD
jgi:hypothetical protein